MSRPEFNPLEGFRPPEPRPGLRTRVLSRARERASAPRPLPLAERLWASTALWRAWGVTVALLLLAHLWLALGTPSPPARPLGPKVTDPTFDVPTVLAHRHDGATPEPRLRDFNLFLPILERSPS
jgi:anti-sigma-K factor RskA